MSCSVIGLVRFGQRRRCVGRPVPGPVAIKLPQHMSVVVSNIIPRWRCSRTPHPVVTHSPSPQPPASSLQRLWPLEPMAVGPQLRTDRTEKESSTVLERAYDQVLSNRDPGGMHAVRYTSRCPLRAVVVLGDSTAQGLGASAPRGRLLWPERWYHLRAYDGQGTGWCFNLSVSCGAGCVTWSPISDTAALRSNPYLGSPAARARTYILLYIAPGKPLQRNLRHTVWLGGDPVKNASWGASSLSAILSAFWGLSGRILVRSALHHNNAITGVIPADAVATTERSLNVPGVSAGTSSRPPWTGKFSPLTTSTPARRYRPRRPGPFRDPSPPGQPLRQPHKPRAVTQGAASTTPIVSGQKRVGTHAPGSTL